MPRSTLFTSESVTEGHPDKLADKVSDKMVTAYLQGDSESHVACETLALPQFLVVGGEVKSSARFDIDQLVRGVILDIGYTDENQGFDYNNVEIVQKIGEQSPDIDRGVSRGDKLSQGAGDQGMMFGYATRDTPSLMPLAIERAHGLTKRLTELRKNGTLPYLRPDGKSQVTVQYGADGKPERIDAVVISSHHARGIEQEQLREDIRKHIIDIVLAGWIDGKTSIHINPTGNFEVGGPQGDSGLTGRKIIVDTYGGSGRHGGGAFSGKDPSKVDRSGAYYGRYVAKNIVGAGLASECEVQVSYAIGVAKPTSISVETFGTEKYPQDKIAAAVRRAFDFRPGAIEDQLRLRSQDYYPYAAYGHMGREDLNAPWEELDKVEPLLRAIKG